MPSAIWKLKLSLEKEDNINQIHFYLLIDIFHGTPLDFFDQLFKNFTRNQGNFKRFKSF